MGMLSDDEHEKLAPARLAGGTTPVPTESVSSDEFMPLPRTEQQKRQPVDWVFCYTYNGLVPHPVLMKSIEKFWTKVMPRFR